MTDLPAGPRSGTLSPMKLRTLPIAVLAASVLLAAGCSSPIVGTWKAADAGANTVLKVGSDKSYSASVTTADGPRKGSSGSWEDEGGNKFRLIQEAGDWPRVVRAELTGKKTLDLFGEGVTAHLKKE